MSQGKSEIVSVLFARQDSVYHAIPDCDVWDVERDALKWTGGNPAVAHPPCRAWGDLAHFAKPRPGERELATWAVVKIRENGGVLEHPAKSKLWKVARLPEPGRIDEFGGWTFPVLQWWWGHKVAKATRLYIVGCHPNQIPEIPFRIGEPDYVLGSTRAKSGRPTISKKAREATPPEFAKWLVTLARRCKPGKIATEV